MSQISSTCIPPSFINRRRPSKSRTLMQSRLQATSRLLNSSAARRDSAAAPCWLAKRASSSLARRSSDSSTSRRTLSLLDMGVVTPALPLGSYRAPSGCGTRPQCHHTTRNARPGPRTRARGLASPGVLTPLSEDESPECSTGFDSVRCVHTDRGSPVIVAPSEVVWILRSDNRSQMLALSRDDPQLAGTRHVEVALLIDLHSIERDLGFGRSHIERHSCEPSHRVSQNIERPETRHHLVQQELCTLTARDLRGQRGKTRTTEIGLLYFPRSLAPFSSA